MRLIARSMTFGALTDLVACVLTAMLAAIGGWGPCGPVNWLATLGMYLQYPGFWIVEEYASINASAAEQLMLIAFVQFIVWSIAWLAILAICRNPPARLVPQPATHSEDTT